MMALLWLVIMLWCVYCKEFCTQGFPPDDRKSVPLATLHYFCSSCTGFPKITAREKPNADEETALPTQKFRGVDCAVFPAVCAVVSPVPAPDGYTSSALWTQLFKVFCASSNRDRTRAVSNSASCSLKVSRSILANCRRFRLQLVND